MLISIESLAGVDVGAGFLELPAAPPRAFFGRARLASTRPPVIAPATRNVPVSIRSGSTS
jgi:hypothetical protein